MSEFAAVLREKAKSPVATYHRFRTSVRDPSLLYLFVEGYDDVSFYGVVCKILGVSPNFVVCFGKKNLDTVFSIYRSTPISDSAIAFIRDRDFDHFLGTVGDSERYFVTCGYAVENYVFTTSSLAAFFHFNMGLDSNEVDVGSHISEFEGKLELFHSTLEGLYATCFASIRSKLSFDLDRVELSAHIKSVLSGNADPFQLTDQDFNISGLFSGVVEAEDEALAKQYCSLGAVIALRGKFLAEFSRVFLNGKFEHLRKQHKAATIQRFNKACGTLLGREALYAVLVSRASLSDRLREFLLAVAPLKPNP
jgi:hypothetical protein